MRKNEFKKLISSYAQALLELLSKEKETEVIEKDIRFLLSFFEKNEEVFLFFSNPANSTKIKSDIIFLLKGHISNVLLNFILLIINNGRFFLLRNILKQFLTLVKKSRNKIEIVITSAITLSKGDIRLISNSVSSFGEVTDFTNIIDPSILGGFIIRIGFTVIDASLRSYLQELLDISEEALLLRGE